MSLTELEVDIANQSLGKIGAKLMAYADQTTRQGVQCNLYYEQTRDSLLRSFEWQFASTRLALVAEWVTDTIYTTDQYVWQDSLLYKCIVAHTSDVFATDLTSADWTLVSTISAWGTGTDYTVGEYVATNALLYKCLVAHTAGTFATDLASEDWILVSVKPVNVFGYNYDLPADSLRLLQVLDDTNITWRPETNTILTDETELDIRYIDTISTTTEWDPLFTELLITRLAKKLLAPLAGSGSGTSSLREDLNTEIFTLLKSIRAIGRQENRGNTEKDTWNEVRVR